VAAHLTTLNEVFYRMLFVAWAGDLCAPARSPEGRSHYDGQKALYLSGSPEGCEIASRRYVKSDDPERAIYPIHVISDKIIDLRDAKATAYYQIDTTHRATDWLPYRDVGKASPTWQISDRARALGLHGMLYASRSKPSLTHLTIFAWNDPAGGAILTPGGDPFSTNLSSRTI